MPKVKVVELVGHSADCYECGTSWYTPENVSDWDEVSEEDLQSLRIWINEQNATTFRTNCRLVLVVEKSIDIPTTVMEYVERAKREIERAKEKKKKAEENRLKKEETLRKKKEDQEKKLLEELQKKYILK